jgi:hypothetical protein
MYMYGSVHIDTAVTNTDLWRTQKTSGAELDGSYKMVGGKGLKWCFIEINQHVTQMIHF